MSSVACDINSQIGVYLLQLVYDNNPTFLLNVAASPMSTRTYISKHSNNPKCCKRVFKLNVPSKCYLFTIALPLNSAYRTSHAYRFTIRTCSDVRRWVVVPGTRQSEVIVSTSKGDIRDAFRVYTSGNIFHVTCVYCPIFAR